MNVVRSIEEVRRQVHEAKRSGARIGLVPTMGALHDGHLSLIRHAKSETNFVAVTIFVNPLQFGPKEDLARYPRPFDRDLELCQNESVHLVFAPDRSLIYPDRFATYVDVEGLSDRLEGAIRPGHFRGVATVVLKLFNIVQADVAYFGQKDAQQAALVRRMVQDLNVPIELRVCPTVRESDGLALSSRNVYLSEGERKQATVLFRALQAARSLIDGGERDVSRINGQMRALLDSEPAVTPDYAELVNPITFEPVTDIVSSVLAAVAARVGSTRLIDNWLIEFHASNSDRNSNSVS